MEKKYVLAKDTPLGKRGDPVFNHEGRETFRFTDENCYIKPNPKREAPIGNHFMGVRAYLLRDGWIEEVKPVEIWVNEYKVVCGFDDKYGMARESKKATLENIVNGRYIRTVHFIEAPEGETK